MPMMLLRCRDRRCCAAKSCLQPPTPMPFDAQHLRRRMQHDALTLITFSQRHAGLMIY